MTVQELRMYLEDFEDDTEVRLMTQQTWPFENSILGVVSSDDLKGDEEEFEQEDENTEGIVYLVEGQQLGYGSKAAWDLV